MHTFKEITNILEEIYKLNEINDIIYINGGIVPYLINNKAATRNHSDIDILVNLKDMDKSEQREITLSNLENEILQ